MVVVGWLVALASAQDPVPPADARPALATEPYATAVRLVDGLFLDPARVDGPAILRAAAGELSEELDWLQVGADGDAVVLSTGDGAELGRVEAHGTADLARALAELERIVVDSGGDLGDVDPQLAVLGGIASTLDPYSRILANERLDRFEVRLSGTEVGIGAAVAWVDGALLVEDLVADGPAAGAGLRIGDQLVRIDGRSTVAMPIGAVTERLRGEVGAAVTLTIARDGEERELVIPRAQVVVPTVTHEVLEGGVGYVAIDHMSQRTVENLEAALDDLRARGGLDHGLVLDLRGNTGGSMPESARAADLFLTQGLLLRTVGRNGAPVRNLRSEMYARADGTEPDVPLVVLVDGRTASGSEILAGALLELDRAALVGSRTFGKGTVQVIYNLGHELRFKLTVARYLLANDRAISGLDPGAPDDGLVPDVLVARVDVKGDQVRFVNWDPPSDVDWDRIVPDVRGAVEADEPPPDPARRGEPPEDLVRELARRAVLASTSASRADVVSALQREAQVQRLDEVARLQAAFAERGIDWQAAPEPGARVDGAVALRAVRGEGDAWTLAATVTNRGDTPVYRGVVELRCDDAPWWDHRVVPIGQLAPGETVTRTVPVEVPPGLEPRVDEVEVRLRGERRPTLQLGAALLETGSSPRPVPRVEVRLLPIPGAQGPHGQPVHRAEVTIENVGRAPILGVVARFGFPDDDAIELLDAEGDVGEISGRSTRTVNLTMEIGPGAPAVLPLTLRVDAARYGELLSWPLALPTSGVPVALQAPAIELHASPTAAVGPYSLPVQVVDDGSVDHAVVTVNGRKVAWARGEAGRLDLVAAFDLLPGPNEVVVRAEDDQGIGVTRALEVRGEVPPDTVDAGM